MSGSGGVPSETMSKIVLSHQPTLTFTEFKIGAKYWALPHLCFSSRGKREKPDRQINRQKDNFPVFSSNDLHDETSISGQPARPV